MSKWLDRIAGRSEDCRTLSLYQVQKLIHQLNRDPRTRERYAVERDAVLSEYELSDEERAAIVQPDIGLLARMQMAA